MRHVKLPAWLWFGGTVYVGVCVAIIFIRANHPPSKAEPRLQQTVVIDSKSDQPEPQLKDAQPVRDYGFRLLDTAHFSPPKDRPLRIGAFCRLSIHHKWGGMQQVAWDRWKAGVKEYGWNVTYITTAASDPQYTTDYRSEGVDVHFVPGTVPTVQSAAYANAALHKVLELHEQQPFDVFLMDSLPLTYEVVAELRKLAPIGATFHGVGIDKLMGSITEAARQTEHSNGEAKLPSSYTDKLSSVAAAAAREASLFGPALDYVIGITPLASREFDEVYRVRRDKLFTIFNGIDISRFKRVTPDSRHAARVMFDLPKDALVVSFSGKLLDSKGFFDLIKATPALLALSERLYIIVAGAGNGDKLCRETDDRHERFYCMGALDHQILSTFYHAADIHLEPALHYLGLNTVVLESICSGIPVVSGDAPRMTATFGFDDAAPAYYRWGDVREMVRAVNETVSMDQAAREAWADRTYRRWCPQFSLQAEVKHYNEMLWWQVEQRRRMLPEGAP